MTNWVASRIEKIRVEHIVEAQKKEIIDLLSFKFSQAAAQKDTFCRILPFLPAPDSKPVSVVEVGCGPGKYVAMLSALGYDVTGVDPISFPDWEIINKSSNVKLIDKVYAENLPFPDESFDHAVCLGALLYFDDPDKALQEIFRVIKPGGKVIIRTVNKNNLYTRRSGKKLDPASKNLYSLPELIAVIKKNGFIVSDSYAYGFWPAIWTDLWWYIVRVWLPIPVQDFLSNLLPAENRVNNIVFCERPTKK